MFTLISAASLTAFIELPPCASLCYFKAMNPSTAAIEPGFHFPHIPEICTKVFCYKKAKLKSHLGSQPAG